MAKKIMITLGVALFLTILFYYSTTDFYASKNLVKAIKNNDIDSVKRIIEDHPDSINQLPSYASDGWQSAMNKQVLYPLTEACRTGNFEIIKILVQNGADVNVNNGITPLSITYTKKCEDWYKISCFLIDNGADLNYTTQYSPNDASVLMDIVQVRPGALANGYEPENNEEVMKAFRYALENCNHDNVNWMRVLQHSVTNDRIEIVKLLLDEKCCDVNDNSVGRTALMFAARDSTPEMIQLLLDYGADKDCKSNEGKTAYDYAVEFDRKDNIPLLEN